MESGESLVSAAALIRILIFLLYATAGLFAHLRVAPHLAKTPRRLANLMLGAQTLIIAVSLLIQPSSSFEDWLWRLDWKYNIPSTFASMQLALVGAVALATAWQAKARALHYRFYLMGIGVFFLVLARDEYFDIHDTSPIFDLAYIAVGAAIAMATIASARLSARRAWMWQACLLTGMAIYAFAAFLMDELIPLCVRLDSIRLGGCLRFAYLEESMEIFGVWLILLAVLGHFSGLAPVPAGRVGRAFFVVPALWFLALVLMGGIRPITMQVRAQPASVEFDSGDFLHAHRIGGGRTAVYVHLYLTPRSWNHDGLGYSVHLVDQVNGGSIASSDAVANLRLNFLLSPRYQPVFREWTAVIVSEDAPRNRALSIVLSLWREQNGEFIAHEIVGSGLKTLGEAQVVLGELVLPDEPSAPSPTAIATFANGFALEDFKMPERARAGETLDIGFAWRSESEASEDFVQFLHLGHQETGNWWVYDQAPLGARLPTRLWYRGLADSELWQVRLPADLAVGRYEVFTGLYRSHDKERLAIINTDGSLSTDDRVLIAALDVESKQTVAER